MDKSASAVVMETGYVILILALIYELSLFRCFTQYLISKYIKHNIYVMKDN